MHNIETIIKNLIELTINNEKITDFTIEELGELKRAVEKIERNYMKEGE